MGQIRRCQHCLQVAAYFRHGDHNKAVIPVSRWCKTSIDEHEKDVVTIMKENVLVYSLSLTDIVYVTNDCNT